MPPRQKITKDMLLEHAFKVAEEQGIMAVTSRSVAASIGCSIQPVFSQFPTMDELRQATFEYACDLFSKELLTFAQHSNFFSKSAQWTLNLARNKPNLFYMLYLSGEFKGNNFIDAMMHFESNQVMISKMSAAYSLTENECKDILLRCCLFLVGIGTMICVNHMEFSDEQVADMMRRTFSDMVIGAKGLGDTEVILKPVNAIEGAYLVNYLTPGAPVKLDVAKDEWF